MKRSFLLTIFMASTMFGQQAPSQVTATKPGFYDGFVLTPEAAEHSFSIETPAQKVVEITDSEYAKMQALAKALDDYKQTLAVKYGWQGDHAIGDAVSPSIEHFIPADHYEFHGRFLLIDKASPAPMFPAGAAVPTTWWCEANCGRKSLPMPMPTKTVYERCSRDSFCWTDAVPCAMGEARCFAAEVPVDKPKVRIPFPDGSAVVELPGGNPK